MIEFRNVQKVYQSKKSSSTQALRGFNLKIGNSGMTFIIGKSGSGKSTFLNLLGGLDQPTSGEIFVHGKNICQFSQKQYDSYRNTYVGFIFQEFNVLEQYNVLENIELALRLQNQKSDLSKIKELLNQLGLSDLEKRNINELSGGQKQRVAIARALIKNPKIILADEPTGNLDKNSSEQIFEILKEISKKQLVIVVSHDIESANRYADRIIELEDGQVVKDSQTLVEGENEPVSFKKSKLPFSYAFKMALSGIKRKPMKFLMTILLTAVSLVFMGFAVNCNLFDSTNLIINTMKKNHDYVYTVSYTNYTHTGYSSVSLEENQVAEMEKKLDLKGNPVYHLYPNQKDLTFTFGTKETKPFLYFKQSFYSFEFVEVKDNRILGNLIGRAPEQPNELVVHKYFADYVMEYGILTPNGTFYYPQNYQELVSSKQELQLGENKVIIVGIIDDDNSPFLSFQKSYSTEDEGLLKYFQNYYVNSARFIYGKGFVDSAILGYDEKSLLDNSFLKRPNQDSTVSGINGNLFLLKEETPVITKNGPQMISSLTKNQIILSLSTLKIFDSQLDTEFSVYLALHRNRNYDELFQEFMQSYLEKNESSIKLSLTIYENRLASQHTTNHYSDIEIVGISLDEKSYLSNQYLEEYHPITKEILDIQFYDDNISHLRKNFQQLVYQDSRGLSGRHYTYNINPIYNDIATVIGVYRWLTYLIVVLSVIFVLFSFLLFINFIAVSISYCKKEIGILRALGASSKDIIKIFSYESLIVGFFSWILSMIGWVISCKLFNYFLYPPTYYIIEPIIMHPLIPIFLLTYIVVIALFITVASIQRITKIKPIEAILNR